VNSPTNDVQESTKTRPAYGYDVYGNTFIFPSTKTKIFVFGECKDQLGIGSDDRTVQSEPAVVNFLRDYKIVKICSGFIHSAALTLDGKVFTFGCFDDGRLGYEGSNTFMDYSKPNPVSSLQNKFIVDVSAGYNHTMFLTRKGEVYGAGSNSYLQLCSPDAQRGSMHHAIEYDDLKIIKIVCGYYHTILISDTGRVYYRGKGAPEGDSEETGEVGSLRHEHIVNAGAGYSHTMFLTKRGQVYVYGDNSAGQLGFLELSFHNVPRLLPNLDNILSCDGGYYHTIFMSRDGRVFTAGSSQYGKLGNGIDDSTTHEPTMLKEFAPLGPAANSVSAGGYHSAVSTVDGKVYVFGHGSFGQCGQGPDLDNFVRPIRVELGCVDSLFISQVSAGGWHTLLLERSTGLLKRTDVAKNMFDKTKVNHLSFCDVYVHCQ